MVDEQGNPIRNATIHTWNDGSFERPAFDLTTISDNNGHFVTDSVFSYGCTEFQIGVSADGFETQTLNFNPLGSEWLNSLPADLIIQLQAD